MIMLILAALASAKAPSTQSAIARCRPALERKVEGQIDTLSVNSSRVVGRSRLLRGRLTAFLGMGPPGPGSASAHHLIRADFQFRCEASRSGVRSTSATPIR
jgi:hypothetical protein